MMQRRDWMKSAACAAVHPFMQAQSRSSAPNFVLLLADDMGWGDPSCYGNTRLKTPNLDRLAAEGVRFENFYAASAVCTPSRAAILTGRYPIRFDIRRHFNDDEAHLPLTTTLPKLLRERGYATAHVGKWHLGGLHQKHIRDRKNSIPGPHQHGFDYYQCQNEEQPLRRRLGQDRMLFRKGGTCLIRNERNVPQSDPYYTRHFEDINGDEAVRLIDTYHREGKRFFLNVWFLAPHQPYEPAPEPFWSRADAPGISDDQRRFRSMVMHLDHKIGQILDKLEETGLRSNTLVLFTSDNGGAWEANIGPWKGGKTDLHEGGIRVPGIVSWPARIRPGRTTRAIGHHCDILPTFCEAAGVSVPASHPRDGVSLLSHLTRSTEPPDRAAIFWQLDLYERIQRHYAKPRPWATEALREDRWKLLASDGRPVALYDIESDPLETKNLLEARSEIASELVQKVRSELTAPRDRSGAPDSLTVQ